MNIRHDTRIRSAAAALALLMVAPFSTAKAQAAIYRCHALNGDLQFQDKPCNAAANTQEARANREGEVVAPAVSAPVEQGTPTVERYTRYLDFVTRERREQAAVDAAETARLQAQAEAARAAAPAVVPFQAPVSCTTIGANGECLSTDTLPYAVVLPPVRRYNGHGYEQGHDHEHDHEHGHRPPVTPAPPAGPRPVGPNPPQPRQPRDPRAEILSLAPPSPPAPR